MKSESETRQKLKQVLYRHQKRKLKANFKKVPGTCLHNVDVELETDLFVGACMYPLEGSPRGVICDPRVAGNAQALKCGLWEPLRDKEEIKVEFQELFEDTTDLGLIAAQYPDVAALLWVLGEGTTSDEEPEEDDPDNPITKGWNWRQWPWSKKDQL